MICADGNLFSAMAEQASSISTRPPTTPLPWTKQDTERRLGIAGLLTLLSTKRRRLTVGNRDNKIPLSGSDIAELRHAVKQLERTDWIEIVNENGVERYRPLARP